MPKLEYQPLYQDTIHVGDVAITGCDNFWILANFRKAQDYSMVASIIEATLEDGNEEAIDIIDNLSFYLGSDRERIEDIRFTSMSTVEFRISKV